MDKKIHILVFCIIIQFSFIISLIIRHDNEKLMLESKVKTNCISVEKFSECSDLFNNCMQNLIKSNNKYENLLDIIANESSSSNMEN